MLSAIIAFLFGGGAAISVIVVAIISNPEKAEKWFALFWKSLVKLKVGLRFAHKKYVQHDFQGSVNEFIKKHADVVPGFQANHVRLEWVDGDVKKQSFLEANRVVVRIKRHDENHANFVKSVYLFISTSLLYRAKRYISPPQGQAIDLFVTTELFREQKPEVVDHFLEEYLHPQIDDGSARVTSLFEKFDVISRGGLFFPVFLQEMDYLGQKVFGKGKSQDIVEEVDSLIEFLQSLALRQVGDDEVDLNFIKKYCRCAVVLIGKPLKLSQSIDPYVKFIDNGLPENVETVYLFGRAENNKAIQQVCDRVVDKFDVVAERKLNKVLLYGEEKRKISSFLAVLRSKRRELYVPTGVGL